MNVRKGDINYKQTDTQTQTQSENVGERRRTKIKQMNKLKIYLYIDHFINDFRLFLRGFEVKQMRKKTTTK